MKKKLRKEICNVSIVISHSYTPPFSIATTAATPLILLPPKKIYVVYIFILCACSRIFFEGKPSLQKQAAGKQAKKKEEKRTSHFSHTHRRILTVFKSKKTSAILTVRS